MKKDTFIFYMQWLRTMEDAQLNNAERMRLIDAIVTYADQGTIPKLPRLLTAVFSPIKTTIDNDAEKYAKILAMNRENGARGGRPKKAKQNPENPAVISENPAVISKTDRSYYDNDYDNDNVFVNDARSVAPDEKEKRTIYEIFFWRNMSKPQEELDRFMDYNSKRKWSALNNPAKRITAAKEWQPADLAPRVRTEFLDMWASLFARVQKERPELAEEMIDVRARFEFQGNEAKLRSRSKALREYIERERPPEILQYIGNLNLTTASP